MKFLDDSLGSAYEWETQLIVCYRQNFISKNEFIGMEDKIQALQSKISNFVDSLEVND